jgi:hypothetical protein
MAEEKKCVDVGRVRIVKVFNRGFHLRDGGGTGDVVAKDGPAIADEVLLKPPEFGGE